MRLMPHLVVGGHMIMVEIKENCQKLPKTIRMKAVFFDIPSSIRSTKHSYPIEINIMIDKS